MRHVIAEAALARTMPMLRTNEVSIILSSLNESYAMNLLYALHYEGIATTPLTMGQKQNKLRLIKRAMSIPEYEMPCVLIGIGSYKDEYKVAVSKRKHYTEYTVVK